MIPITNNGTSPLTLGSFVVLPGETRLLNPADVPPHLRPIAEIAAPAPAPDAVGRLADKKASEIKDALSGLTDEEMDRLDAIEATREKPRASVSEAITKERLRRGDLREKFQEFNLAAEKMDDNTLRAYRENVMQHPELVAAIDAELAARAERSGG